MEYRKLGASGLEVSALAYGAWQLGDKTYWGDSSWEDDEASVQAAFDAGINLFDTAAGYGEGASDLRGALCKAAEPCRLVDSFLEPHP